MRARVLAALWTVAAAWFVPGTLVTLEGVDEGHLVYFASRVAEGALPYRDFHHMYGPGTFFLNGALLALAGQDLLAVRLGLVVVKATLSVAVAYLASAAGGVAFGLLAWGVLLAVWGAPLWVFATPYASVYQVTFDLLALAALLALRGRSRAFLAGVCLGVAGTFKQTSGLLAAVGILAFLLYEGCSDEAPHGRGDPLATAIRLALLGAGLAATGVYAASFSELRALVILLTPLAILVTWLGARIVRDRGRRRDDLIAVAWTILGAAVAPAAYLLYYALRGASGALLNDTLWGLPQKVVVVVPLAPFAGAAALQSAVVILVLVAVELGRRGVAGRGTRRAASWGAAAATVAALATIVVTPQTVLPASWGRADLSPALISWLPVMVTWIAVVQFLSAPVVPAASAAPVFLACLLLPGLQPIGDLPHILLALPVFLLPLAALAARYADRGWPGSRVATLAVGVLAVALVTPFARSFGGTIAQFRVPAPGYERATGVRDSSRSAGDLRALIAYLERTPADTRLLVLPNTPIIHFLAGRRSALDMEDFGVILGTYSHVSDDDARALVNQDAVIPRLEREPVLVVLLPNDPAMPAVRRVFPELVAFVDARFREVMRFGPYEVLAPTGQPGR
jgi:hypothetical protein